MEPSFIPVIPDSYEYSQLTNYVEYVLYQETAAWENWHDWAIEYGDANQILFAQSGSDEVFQLRWNTDGVESSDQFDPDASGNGLCLRKIEDDYGFCWFRTGDGTATTHTYLKSGSSSWEDLESAWSDNSFTSGS